MRASRFALVALLLANLVPLAGVAFAGWRTYDVMLVYWLENGVIGAFTLLRMATAGREPWSTVVLGPFFVVHYGLFWVVHGVFVVALFGPGGGLAGGSSAGPASSASGAPLALPIVGDVPWVAGAGWAVLGLIVSHGVSYLENWWRAGERREATPSELMSGAYGRVVVLHVALILGGFAVTALRAPLVALVALVALKIGLDVSAHLREHARRRTGAALSSADAGTPAS